MSIAVGCFAVVACGYDSSSASGRVDALSFL